MTSRREFLQTIGSSAFFLPEDTITIEIGLYLTEHARNKHGSSGLNELAHFVDRLFQRTFGDSYDYYIGPHTIVSFDARSSAEGTARSWKNRDDGSYEHSNLLVLSYEEAQWNEHAGYAYFNEPYATIAGYERIGQEALKLLACHEIGHNLNARHKHGTGFEDTRTIMNTDTSKERLNFFSDEAIDVMKDNL